MKIETREELDNLLKYCKVIPYSLPQDGGKFYKIKNQSFIYPDGKIQTREYIDKKRASVVVPITEEGRFVFVVQPIGLAEEGSLIEFPAGYFEFDENGMQAGIRELAEETGCCRGSGLLRKSLSRSWKYKSKGRRLFSYELQKKYNSTFRWRRIY